MPTGYTAIVAENDNVSLREFALRCARSFGALIEMRDAPMDTPIPEKFESGDYYAKELEQAKARYEEYIKNPPTDENLARQYEEYAVKETARIESANAERRNMKARYEAMLAKVINWHPPTPEHTGLKEFMIKQLTDSIDGDCKMLDLHIETKEEYIEYMKKREPEWLLEEIGFYEERMRKEREAYDAKNKWIEDLRNSL